MGFWPRLSVILHSGIGETMTWRNFLTFGPWVSFSFSCPGSLFIQSVIFFLHWKILPNLHLCVLHCSCPPKICFCVPRFLLLVWGEEWRAETSQSLITDSKWISIYCTSGEDCFSNTLCEIPFLVFNYWGNFYFDWTGVYLDFLF